MRLPERLIGTRTMDHGCGIIRDMGVAATTDVNHNLFNSIIYSRNQINLSIISKVKLGT